MPVENLTQVFSLVSVMLDSLIELYLVALSNGNAYIYRRDYNVIAVLDTFAKFSRAHHKLETHISIIAFLFHS